MIGRDVALLGLLAQVASAPQQELSRGPLMNPGLHRQLHAHGGGEQAGLFKGVQPCEALVSIVGNNNTATPQWGYFTEHPTQSLIQSCAENNSVLITDGVLFPLAVRDQSPLVKVFRAESLLTIAPELISQDYSTSSLFVTGSVVVLDCQDNWVDFRELEVAPAADAAVVYFRCHLLLDQDGQGNALQTWTFSSSSHFPCTRNSTYSQESPGHFDNFHVDFGPTRWYMHNHTHWCWTDAVLRQVLPEMNIEGAPQRQWWIILVGVSALMACAGALLYFLSPWCIRAVQQWREGSKRPEPQQPDDTPRAEPAQTAHSDGGNGDSTVNAVHMQETQRHHTPHVPPLQPVALALSDGGDTTASVCRQPG